MKEYTVADCFWDDYAQVAIIVKGKNKWGLIDRLGHEVIPAIYDRIQYMGGEVAFVNVGFKEGLKYEYSGKWVIVNLKNEIVATLRYSEVWVGGNQATVCYRNRWGVIDFDGNIIILLKYNYISLGGGDGYYYLFELQGKYGIIDNQGGIIMPPIYDRIITNTRFDSRGWMSVCQYGRWAYINRKGETVLKIISVH